MAAKGIIEKELSYIMGIPESPNEIETYDDLIKRLEKNSEFNVKVLKNDTEKFLRVDYKDEQYIVQILIEEFEVPELFTVAHQINETDYNKIMESKLGVTTIVEFGKSNIDSYHLQLKLISTMIPNLLGIMDFSSQKLLSGRWAKMAAESYIQPAPEYIYTIQAINDEDGSVWLHTHGLRRCGSLELEIIGSNTESYQDHGTVIQMIAKNIVTNRYLEEEKEPFYIGEGIVGTWVPLEKVLDSYPSECLGGSDGRNDEHAETAVIYVYLTEEDYKNGKYSHISSVNEVMQNNPLYFISDEETMRMKGLALERWEYFTEAITNPENNGLIKFGILVDEKYRTEGDANLEHLWFHIEGVDGDKVRGTLINQPYYIENLNEEDKMTIDKSELTDWIIYTPFAEITPDKVYLLDERKKYFN
ncbi:DUF4026 domain-containing protein [uncultured Fusobacterium sp.]|uniref:DUF4026 domain-containing protein n=1 Tax=uncultured Fusobacterium sp. TaxID=159267 RepID=UPI0027DCDC6F|nr:DUF4026 domain-containing protein [uncultured Fusobacterium sp.]